MKKSWTSESLLEQAYIDLNGELPDTVYVGFRTKGGWTRSTFGDLLFDGVIIATLQEYLQYVKQRRNS